MLIINPNNLEDIISLKIGDIAFPEIEYVRGLELQLPRTTLKGAYSIITKYINPEIFDVLKWDVHGDIEWQNLMLEKISNEITQMIDLFRSNENARTDDFLKRIFIWIQLWGGITGRRPFVKNSAFYETFQTDIYRKSIDFILNDNFTLALTNLNQLKGIQTAFATKHIYFWSQKKAPILDRLIANIIFGKSIPLEKDYKRYYDSLNTALTSLPNSADLTISDFERCLFNWANTDEGIRWRALRIKKAY
jgi:hypothetical protein